MLDYSQIFLIKSPTRKQWQLRPLWSRSNNAVSLQWKKKKIECLLRKCYRDAGHIFWRKKRRRCWEKTSIHRGNERPKAKRGLKFGGGEELCGIQRVRAVYKESGLGTGATCRCGAPDRDQLFLVHPASAGAGVKCWSVSCSVEHLPAKVSPRRRQMVTVHFLLCVGPSESGTAT